MYAKEKSDDISPDSGKFMYVNNEFVWTKDKRREFEAHT